MRCTTASAGAGDGAEGVVERRGCQTAKGGAEGELEGASVSGERASEVKGGTSFT
jgi:hypothetical protein